MMMKDEDWSLCGRFTAGNGGAMRMGPLGAFYFDSYEDLIDASIKASLLTHRDPRGISAAVSMAIATSFLCKVEGKLFVSIICVSCGFEKKIIQYN